VILNFKLVFEAAGFSGDTDRSSILDERLDEDADSVWDFFFCVSLSLIAGGGLAGDSVPIERAGEAEDGASESGDSLPDALIKYHLYKCGSIPYLSFVKESSNDGRFYLT
jgi:hypothetical protein